MMMDLTHARTRTANRLIRSQMPCPLGHMGVEGGNCFEMDSDYGLNQIILIVICRE